MHGTTTSQEPVMNRRSLHNVSFSSATTATLAALVLAASAFISAAPAAAATGSAPATYCLSGDSQNDCGFMSFAQCEATASGGLGVCDVAPMWSGRGTSALSGSHAWMRVGRK
jgi:hypothetical protein